MQTPTFPLGLLARLYQSFRKNPCSIEFLKRPNGVLVRIRNDSDHAVEIDDIEFFTKAHRFAQWEYDYMPLGWLTYFKPQTKLEAKDRIEHAVTFDELEPKTRWLRIGVRHSRSRYPVNSSYKIVGHG